MKRPADDPRLRAAVRDACQRYGLDDSDARLIHRYNNAIYLLPNERAVARIAGPSMSVERAAQVVRVIEWLVHRQGVAAVCPLSDTAPVAVDGLTVSFWRHYPQPPTAPPASPQLAAILRVLHQVDAVPAGLPRWVPLASLASAIDDAVETGVLTGGDAAWLGGRIGLLREEIARLDWRLGEGVIHGDAWAGNLLWDVERGPDHAVLGDWDNVSVGPREVDLVPSWHAAIRYGRGPAWSAAFADVYGHDLAGWPGFATLLDMRDPVQLTGPLRRAHAEPVLAGALRERWGAIRRGDRTAVWRAY